jgi:hypothetical protein
VEGQRVVGHVPFSSRRRRSALDLGELRLVLGAPERLASVDPAPVERARGEAGAGRRVFALGRFDRRGWRSRRARGHRWRARLPTSSSFGVTTITER